MTGNSNGARSSAFEGTILRDKTTDFGLSSLSNFSGIKE